MEAAFSYVALGLLMLGIPALFFGAWRLRYRRNVDRQKSQWIAWAGFAFIATSGAIGIVTSFDATRKSIPEWTFTQPSSWTTISTSLLAPNTGDGKKITLRDVDRALRSRLGRAGIVEVAYYSAPGGVVIATRLYKITDDGSVDPDQHGIADARPAVFDASSYLKALFTAPIGRYRTIAFAITRQPFTTSRKSIDLQVAEEWYLQGANGLPTEMQDIALDGATTITVMVFEFRKLPNDPKPVLLYGESMPIARHLSKLQIL